MKILKEFREFAVKGNVFDMAVGVVVGAAFGKIVSSLVSDIVMPALSLLFNTQSLGELSFQVQRLGTTGEESLVSINYGSFLCTVIDFLIIAVCLFFVVKGVNSLRRRMEKPAEPAAPPPLPEPSDEAKLLTEIRDLLQKK